MQNAIALTRTAAPKSRAAAVDTSDEALMAAIADGDKRAMNVLFARHNVRVYRFIVRMTGRASLAEDLVNEVFVDAWRQADKFESRSQVSTWLLAIARFKAISAMRQRRHETMDQDALERIQDTADNPEETLEKNDRSAMLQKCLALLSPAHREIIDLVYYHEKSVAEAGAIIGIPQATVKTRMFYARKQLAELYQQAEAGRILQ